MLRAANKERRDPKKAMRALIVLAGVVVALGACGSDDPSSTTSSSSSSGTSKPPDPTNDEPLFTLSVDPPQVLIHPGETQTVTVTLNRAPTFAGRRVNVIFSNLPVGVSAPSSVIDASSAKFILTAGASTTERGATTSTLIEGIALESFPGETITGPHARARTNFDVTTSAPFPTLDATFGQGGKTLVGAARSHDEALTIAIQPDGKIITGGVYRTGYTTVPAIARYLTTGALDISFGANGIVLLPMHESSLAVGVALQPDGKIIVLEPMDFTLTRLDKAGAVDPTFGTNGNGSTSASFATDARAAALVVQPNGQIVVAGAVMGTAAEDFALARFAADGSLDATFGTAGRITTIVSADTTDEVTSLALETNASATVSIIAAGNALVGGGGRRAVVARYLGSNGALDASFNGTGIVTLASSVANADDVISNVALASGKILISGHRHDPAIGTADAFQVMRLTSTGALDTTFDADGIAVATFAQDAIAHGLVVSASGKILVAGEVKTAAPDTFHLALARLDDAGALDATFGTGGRVTSIIGDGSGARAVAVQADTNIVLAGHALNGPNSDVLVARYTDGAGVVGGGGAADVLFDGDGKATTSFGPGDEELRALVVQTDGKIVAVGTAFNGSDFDILVARVQANGILDPTFAGGRGWFVYDHGTKTSEFAYDVRVQPDGKIVVGCQGGPGTIVLRLTDAGTLDPTFGASGVATAVGGDGFGLALQSQGEPKIVVGGPSSAGDFFLARFTAAGILDKSGSAGVGFGTIGTTTTDFGFGDRAITLAVDSKGKIIVAGHVDHGAPPNFFDLAIARYEANGALDTTWNGTGKQTFDTASVELLYAVALQADDKVLVGGRMQLPNRATSLGIFRTLASGALDTTFGVKGRANVDLGDGSQASAILVEPSRSILAAGRSADDRVALVRLSPSGEPMWPEQAATNGSKSFLTTLFGSHAEAYALARQSDGKLLVVGYTHGQVEDQAMFVRYTP